MNKYEEIASNVVKHVGGKENIDSVTNCMTRLRFTLKDVKKANVEELQKVKGVQGVVSKNGQFQVVIGSDVSKVCDEIKKIGNFSDAVKNSNDTEEKTSLINRALGAITAIFQPVLPAICGAGMIKAVLALLTAFHIVEATSQTYELLAMVADSAFYFLPVFLAFSSAKRFRCNTFIAAVLGAMLIHPTFTGIVAAGKAFHFMGLPVKLVSYGSSVVPVILIVLVQSYVEKFIEKITPNVVKVFMVPLLVFLIMTPISFLAVGPLGSFVGDILCNVFEFLNNEARWVIPVVMGAFCPLFVMTGMHYSFLPVQLAQFATLGYGTITGPGMLVSNLSQAGASFAVALRTKDKEMKSTAFSSATTALFGITEPALYGVTMKLKRPLITVMISGGVAGLWAGIGNLRAYSSSLQGLTALPVYICDDFSNVVNAMICMAIALIVSFVLTFFFGVPKEEVKESVETKPAKEEKETKEALNKYVSVNAPLDGEVVPLSEVNDDVFSNEIIGPGAAIIPEDGKIYAPFDGTVNTVFPTKHAYGLTSDQGLELMIHVGLDTVQLEGKHFECYVENGQSMKKGDLLGSFDINAIKEEGYDVITPVVVANSDQYIDVITTKYHNIDAGEEMIKVFQ